MFGWALFLVGEALAGDPTTGGWTIVTPTDPVEPPTSVALADDQSTSLMLVDCGTGKIAIDAGDPVDTTYGYVMFGMRLENDPFRVEVLMVVTEGAPTVAVAYDPAISATLAAREQETLEVVAPMKDGSRRKFTFTLDGASSAFDVCGLDALLPAPLLLPVSHMQGVEVDEVVLGIPGSFYFFHHSEVRVKRQVPVGYPEEAVGLGETTCRVRVFLDTKGVPTRVVPDRCPEVFHATLVENIAKWRWHPATYQGERVEGTFVFAVKFTP